MSNLKTATPIMFTLLAAVGLSGCATTGYVDEQIATVNQRMDGADTRLQSVETIANNALAEAQAASGQAMNATTRLDQLNSRVDGLDQRMQQRVPRN